VDKLLILCGQHCAFECYGRKEMNWSLIRFCPRGRKHGYGLYVYGHSSFVRNFVTDETPV